MDWSELTEGCCFRIYVWLTSSGSLLNTLASVLLLIICKFVHWASCPMPNQSFPLIPHRVLNDSRQGPKITIHTAQYLIYWISLSNTAIFVSVFIDAVASLIGRPFHLWTHKELVCKGRATELQQDSWQKFDLSASDLMNVGRAISDGQNTEEHTFILGHTNKWMHTR